MSKTIGRLMPLFLLGTVATAPATIIYSNNPGGDLFTTSSSTNHGQAIGATGWAYNNVRSNGTVGIQGSQSWMQRSGNGSLVFSTPGNAAKADAEFYINPTVNSFGNHGPGGALGLLKDLTHLSFDWYRDSSSTVAVHLHPVIRLLVVDPIANQAGYLVYEGIYNGFSTAVVDAWQSTDVVGGNFNLWATGSLPGAFTNYNTTLSQWQLNTNLVVVGLSVGVGSGWNGTFLGAVDNVTIGFNGNATTYNFEVTAVPGDPVPEPFTMGLVGAAALAALKRRRAKKA